ncbi:hypothetical protein CS542_01310 [Pedobacter sp. IW39]|nr:hypothetical protein CS542_01310 [Pedobacter sp. IW39]
MAVHAVWGLRGLNGELDPDEFIFPKEDEQSFIKIALKDKLYQMHDEKVFSCWMWKRINNKYTA